MGREGEEGRKGEKWKEEISNEENVKKLSRQEEWEGAFDELYNAARRPGRPEIKKNGQPRSR